MRDRRARLQYAPVHETKILTLRIDTHFLFRQSKAANFARMSWIADVDTTVNFPAEPRCTGGGVDDVAAVVKITMRSGAAGFKMSDPFGLVGSFTSKMKKPSPRAVIGPAPAGSNAFEAGRSSCRRRPGSESPGVFRAGNVSAIFRRRRIGNIDDTPASVPKVATYKYQWRFFSCSANLKAGLPFRSW
jgi:hypothetical protein